MIPSRIYLQYVGDSDEKPTGHDNISDADVTWSRERIFKHDLVFYRRKRRLSPTLGKGRAVSTKTKISLAENEKLTRIHTKQKGKSDNEHKNKTYNGSDSARSAA